MSERTVNASDEKQIAPGRWVTAKVYSEVHGIPEQSLSTWRMQDRRHERTEPVPGFPKYRHFGRTVRYWLEPGSYDAGLVATIAPNRIAHVRRGAGSATTTTTNAA